MQGSWIIKHCYMKLLIIVEVSIDLYREKIGCWALCRIQAYSSIAMWSFWLMWKSPLICRGKRLDFGHYAGFMNNQALLYETFDNCGSLHWFVEGKKIGCWALCKIHAYSSIAVWNFWLLWKSPLICRGKKKLDVALCKIHAYSSIAIWSFWLLC
jgi:hypothetical protein